MNDGSSMSASGPTSEPAVGGGHVGGRADEAVGGGLGSNPSMFSQGSISRWLRAKHNALMVADRFMTRGMAPGWSAEHRQRLQERVQVGLEKSPPGTLFEIPRRRDLSPREFYREYLRPGKPVLLEGVAKDWPCCQKWSTEFLAEQYGDDRITVAPTGVPFADAPVKDTVSLREVLRNEDADEFKYLRFHPMLNLHPELADDVPAEWFQAHKGRRSLWSSNYFFIGTKGTSTDTHNAQPCNLFALVKGEKLWTLYPPGYTALMDPPTSHSPFRLSRHNKGSMDDPIYERLNGYRVHMRAGDVLWNPPFWWHNVRNLTDTIGFGFRWNDHMLALKMHPTMLFVDLFLRDPSWFKLVRDARSEARLARERRASMASTGS